MLLVLNRQATDQETHLVAIQSTSTRLPLLPSTFEGDIAMRMTTVHLHLQLNPPTFVQHPSTSYAQPVLEPGLPVPPGQQVDHFQARMPLRLHRWPFFLPAQQVMMVQPGLMPMPFPQRDRQSQLQLPRTAKALDPHPPLPPMTIILPSHCQPLRTQAFQACLLLPGSPRDEAHPRQQEQAPNKIQVRAEAYDRPDHATPRRRCPVTLLDCSQGSTNEQRAEAERADPRGSADAKGPNRREGNHAETECAVGQAGS
mmetsp:Transcript_89112/g.237864  ORF Transcript_89112/g.237864 Transcript_89112/m.237864 type:complete len:256 (+) Transcript_89112:1531-2298(+)